MAEEHGEGVGVGYKSRIVQVVSLESRLSPTDFLENGTKMPRFESSDAVARDTVAFG